LPCGSADHSSKRAAFSNFQYGPSLGMNLNTTRARGE
jgi:hypothetical protein